MDVFICEYMHVNADVLGGQRPWFSLELELQAVVDCSPMGFGDQA